jgi:hypothetical protein
VFLGDWGDYRYAIRGIATEIGLDIQLILWAIIDNRKEGGVEVGYLQVFEWSIARQEGALIQKLLHRQECPPISNVYYLSHRLKKLLDVI